VEAIVGTDTTLNEKLTKLVNEFTEFMNDDLNTAKVIANIFEIVPIINAIKDKHIAKHALSAATVSLLKEQLKAFITDIFGLVTTKTADNNKLEGVLQLLINIRKEAKQRKDFVTSDKIRNELAALGVQLKDEKDGGVSYTI
jgi:cysteinyl-tRNA synthetase